MDKINKFFEETDYGFIDRLKDIIGGIIGFPIAILIVPFALILYLLFKDEIIYNDCDKELGKMTTLENIDLMSCENLFI